MKQVSIQIPFDDEKLEALKIFLSQKGDPEARLTRSQEPPTIVVSDVGQVFTGSHTTA